MADSMSGPPFAFGFGTGAESPFGPATNVGTKSVCASHRPANPVRSITGRPTVHVPATPFRHRAIRTSEANLQEQGSQPDHDNSAPTGEAEVLVCHPDEQARADTQMPRAIRYGHADETDPPAVLEPSQEDEWGGLSHRPLCCRLLSQRNRIDRT